jgi:hypothetical protein
MLLPLTIISTSFRLPHRLQGRGRYRQKEATKRAQLIYYSAYHSEPPGSISLSVRVFPPIVFSEASRIQESRSQFTIHNSLRTPFSTSIVTDHSSSRQFFKRYPDLSCLLSTMRSISTAPNAAPTSFTYFQNYRSSCPVQT